MKKILVIVICVVLLARLLILIFSPTSQTTPKSPTTSFVRLNKQTNFVDQIVKKFYPEPQASLLSGILVGTKAQMPKDFYLALQRTGTLHIIALSGTNITMLISFLNIIFKPLGKRKASFLSIAGIIIFIFFVGPSASVVRAGIMGSMAMIAILFGRLNIPFISLFIAGVVMVLISPHIIFDIGFQLSFMATLGIMLFGKNSEKKEKSNVKKFLNFLKAQLRVTLCAQLFTTPIIFYNFHQLSLIAPLSNLLVGWTVVYLMAGGFIVVLTAVFFEFLNLFFLAQMISWFLLPLLNWFIWVIQFTASFSFSAVKF